MADLDPYEVDGAASSSGGDGGSGGATAVIDSRPKEYSLPFEVLQGGIDARKTGIDVASLLRKQSELASVAEMRARDAGTASARTAATFTEGMLSAQNAMQESLKLLSGDVMDPNSLKAISMKEFVTRSQEAKDKLEDIKAKQSVT